ADGRGGGYVNGQGQTLVLVPGPVEFRMGAPPWDADRVPESEAPHRRRVGRSFALGSKAVTVAEYQRFLKDRPEVFEGWSGFLKRYSPEPGGPILGVTWYEAAQYCNWLSAQEGLPEEEWCYPKHADIKEGMKPYPDYLKRKGYRLPTEAEWEYACRAGAVTPRYYGESLELLPRYAWFLANSQERAWPVGQKRPNDLGVFDMHGNVWSWCQDPGSLYPKQQGTKAVVDKEDTTDILDNIKRVVRGGSFIDLAWGGRSPDRDNGRPSLRADISGLRVA